MRDTFLKSKSRSPDEFIQAQGYKIGEYAMDKAGKVTGPVSKELVDALEAKGFTSRNEEGENDHE